MVRTMGVAIAVLLLGVASPVAANVWEKFYSPIGDINATIPATAPPEKLPASKDPEADIVRMWERGYAAIGQSSFNAVNASEKSAVKLATKLKATYLVIQWKFASRNTGQLPRLTSTTTTSQSGGTVWGRTGSGTYSGTTTSTQSGVTWEPFEYNRYDVNAIYFREVPRTGIGVLTRELTPQDIAQAETQRGLAIRAIRRGSPAYDANLLPGDVIVAVNGKPIDLQDWLKEWNPAAPSLVFGIMRKGERRDITVTRMADWQ